jgi:hypothetical protein
MDSTNPLEKQKAIGQLRKAATLAKTQLNEAKRHVREYTTWFKEQPGRVYLAEQIERFKAESVVAEAAFLKAQKQLDDAVAALPPVPESKFSSALKWFSGTALIKARDALELLDASLAHGSWLPGASRKVRAALGKANVAKKKIAINKDSHRTKAESAIDYAVNYGAFKQMSTLTLEDARRLNKVAFSYYEDFKPVVDIMDELDATRPVPVFTDLGVSETLTATLKAFEAVKVTVAPLKRKKKEYLDKNGKQAWKYVYYLDWPKGTKHGTSRYRGTDNNRQCEACGHAIKNGFNWVPLVLWGKDGTPKSCWTGRDCAESLFGVKMTGDLEIMDQWDSK